jgi:hypothetical protein
VGRRHGQGGDAHDDEAEQAGDGGEEREVAAEGHDRPG